jgi:SAM-dependent methyltransferase
MSVNASWLRMFLEMHKQYRFRGNVVIWGVQDVHMNHDEAAELMRERGVPYVDIPESERGFMLSKNQQQWTSDPRRFMATKDLFRMMGFTSTKTLDAFPDDKPDILCDLSQPLPEEYKHKFDLLIDIGVIEHTSNGFQALENAGNLLKVGGHFVSLTPLISPIQAAIFHPNPPFYYDILSANGFDNFKSYITWMPDWDQHTDIRAIWLEYQYDDAVSIFRPHYYTSFFVVTRKTRHVNKFRTVLQNYYIKWHNEAGIPKPGNFTLSNLRLADTTDGGADQA